MNSMPKNLSAAKKKGLKITGFFSFFTSYKVLSVSTVGQTQPKGGCQTDWKMLNICSSLMDRRVKRNVSEDKQQML